MQSQARAAKGVNQEQLALYYGIGRFISNGSRKRNWGEAVIDGISKRLKVEIPGLRGFGTSNPKNMRAFYESWNMLEPNSPIQIGELSKGAEIGGVMAKTGGLEADYGSSAIQIALVDVKRSVGKGVVKSVVKIFDLIAQYPDITRERLARKVGLSVRGVEKNLAQLKSEGKIVRVGGRKGGHWEVAKGTRSKE